MDGVVNWPFKVEADVSGVSELEKRIANNIERQRLDFQRQARLLDEVQRDVSRLRDGRSGGGAGCFSFEQTTRYICKSERICMYVC